MLIYHFATGTLNGQMPERLIKTQNISCEGTGSVFKWAKVIFFGGEMQCRFWGMLQKANVAQKRAQLCLKIIFF